MKKITANEIMAHWGKNNITPILAAFEEMSAELEALEGRKGHSWPDGAVKIRKQYVYDNGTIGPVTEIPRPLPPKITRERTREELEKDLAFGSVISLYVAQQLDLTTLQSICTAAGISTTTEEV